MQYENVNEQFHLEFVTLKTHIPGFGLCPKKKLIFQRLSQDGFG